MSDDNDNNNEGGDGTSNPPKQVTQADVDRVAAAEASRGKRLGRSELLKELGFENADELRDLLTAQRSKEDDALNDAERKLKAAEDKERKADEKARRADSMILAARIERALEKAGVPAAASPKVSKLIEGLDVDSDDDAVTVAVELLKAEMPEVFSAKGSAGDPPPLADGDAGKPPPPGGKPAGTSSEQAMALLHQRHPQTVKS